MQPLRLHIAALASRETGGARKVVELLAKAIAIAEETTGRLFEKEVDAAEIQLEVDKTVALIKALPMQQRLALQAWHALLPQGSRRILTGQAYRMIKEIIDVPIIIHTAYAGEDAPDSRSLDEFDYIHKGTPGSYEQVCSSIDRAVG